MACPPRLWLVLLFAQALAQTLSSQEMAASDPSPRVTTEAAGCVLLLNDNVLFGSVEHQGEWIILRNGEGNQTRLHRSRVACCAPSLRELFEFRCTLRRAGDPQVHLKDASWCLRYGLHDLAAAELQQVYRLDPGNASAAVIEQQLRSAIRGATAGRITEAGPTSANDDPRVANRLPLPERLPAISWDQLFESLPESTSTGGIGAIDAAEYSTGDGVVPAGHFTEVSRVNASDLSAESIQIFTRHIQPLLLNRCGQCHSHRSGSRWSLLVPGVENRPTARMSRENLAATIPFLDRRDPAASELLVMGKQAHGGVEPPLALGDEAAVAMLVRWIETLDEASGIGDAAIGNRGGWSNEDQNGGRPIGGTGPSFAVARERPPLARANGNEASGSGVIPTSALGEVTPAKPKPVADANVSKLPERIPKVGNPFDPEIFNRRFHSQ